MSDNYESECARINPRLEREINDREKRIQELLKRATGISPMVKEDEFGISIETSKRSSFARIIDPMATMWFG